MKRVALLTALLLQLNGFAQSAKNAEKEGKKANASDSITSVLNRPDPHEQVKAPRKLPADSAQANFIRDSLKLITPKLLRMEARIDSRASSFQKAEVNIYGYYAGVMIKSKLSLGLAYYRINTILPATTVVNGMNTHTSLVVNCGSINSELIYYNRRFISLGFPLEIALGQYNLTNTMADNNDKLINQQIKFLAFANFGLSGTFKPFQFLGLKLMVGYRKSIYPEEKVFEFNGVYSSLGLFVDFADIKTNLKMYRLMKHYGKVQNALSTYVDLFTD